MSPTATERWRRLRALVGELLELPDEARAARLAEVEPGLAEEALSLLAVDDAVALERFERAVVRQAAGLVEAAARASVPVAATAAGLVLGPWRLERPLGRGGMAEVWEARRHDGQFDQVVAVKLLKRGMDSEEIVARFLRERQILAALDHPGIARLFDGGLAPDGRPYFVLEKIDGEPITDWCRARKLDLTARLRLLVAVAAAVSAAHRRLVVHRDLKPSNILVTSAGQVKLLDFGIAKLLAEEEGAVHATRSEVRVLTPAYAAPEQILGQPVSTATDVYSLGVVAYELLTGRLPHRRGGRGVGELAAAVASETIERPSTAVLAIGLESAPPTESASARRAALHEARHAARRLRGDLDAIVLTALRREPERRYGSVEALAEDLERYLDRRPVAARADSIGYRARKFVGRHRLAVAAAAVALAALISGLAVFAWQAERARASAAAAESNARRAERVKEFLIGLFEVADPEQSGGGTVTAAELLDQAGRRLPHELAAEPAIQAELLESVARIDRSLGRLDSAERLAERARELRQALPEEPSGLGEALATLGSVRLSQGRLDEAEALLVDGLGRLETAGAGELATARARSDLAQVAFWRERLAAAEAGERAVWESYRRALGDEHVLAAIHRRNLGVILLQQNRLDEAEAALRASQAVLERQLGEDHPNLAQSYLNLAALLDSRGRREESEPLHRRALEIRRLRLGDAHPSTGQSLQLLGVFLLAQRRWDEAEAVHREALELFRAIDPRHFEVGKILHGLGQVEAGRGRPAAAEARLAEAVELFRATLGERHPFVWMATANLARQVGKQGRLAEAEELLRECHRRLVELTAPDDEYVLDVESRLGEVLRGRGAVAEALELHRHALAGVVRIYGERHVRVAEAHVQIALDLDAAGLPCAVEAAAADAIFGELDPDHPRRAELALLGARAARRLVARPVEP